ncbi:MAG: hypothetical protein HUU37_02515 [Bdellovibrionales bacterium]|nr:hypothetical protein [Bdellovibrionales bacterium]
MAIQPRKKQAKKPTSLPQEFLNSVGELFNKQFQAERGEAQFLVHGSLYMDEAVVCVSLTAPRGLRAASFHLSIDLPKSVADQPDQVTERLRGMVDLAASWFAQCFARGQGIASVLEEMTDLGRDWELVKWEGLNLFVRVNADNQALENAADKILQDAGFDPDDEEEPPPKEDDEEEQVEEARRRLQKLVSDISDDDDSGSGQLH